MEKLIPSVSLIIPTHNRCKVLNNLLNCLTQQTYPLEYIEVIVVADGCKDATIDMLSNYKAPYKLQYIEQQGQGAATARNNGAKAAKNGLLLFIDDDIEPSAGFVQAHVQAHEHPNQVVIGYLPFALPQNAGFFHQKLWAWWEDKFYLMRNPGYWHNYEDLLSGNFSIEASLFRQVNGFDTTFRCREDYELGARLLKAEADFFFSKDAWGIHRDEVTDLKRSLGRKRQEGCADVQFANTHPDLFVRLGVSGLAFGKRWRRLLLLLAFKFPKILDGFATFLVPFMNICEWFRLRTMWSKLNAELHGYWYIRGVTDALHNRKNLNIFLQKHTHAASKGDQNDILEIDLKRGLPQAEQALDNVRPTRVRLKFGSQLVGDIYPWAGSERLRGAHLQLFLSTKFSWPLMEAITFDKDRPIGQQSFVHSEVYNSVINNKVQYNVT